MADAYTPIFRSILTSTIWLEAPHVKVVWLTMLLMCDRNGLVEGAIPGIANAAVVTVDQCREAIEVLLAPDPDSRTPEFDGRRLEKVDGGWKILNHKKHREKMGLAATGNAARVARHRAKKKLLEQGVTGETLRNGETLANNDLDPRSLDQEEKREETRVTRSKKPKAVAVECPEFMKPTDATIAVGVITGRSWIADFAAMRDWALAKGERKVDWQAALRGWMRRAAEGQGKFAGGQGQRRPTTPRQPSAPGGFGAAFLEAGKARP